MAQVLTLVELVGDLRLSVTEGRRPAVHVVHSDAGHEWTREWCPFVSSQGPASIQISRSFVRPPFLFLPPVAQGIPQRIDARQHSLKWAVNSPEPQFQFSSPGHHQAFGHGRKMLNGILRIDPVALGSGSVRHYDRGTYQSEGGN